MGCGGASKHKITAPEIERPLPTENDTGTKPVDSHSSKVPMLPLAGIPRQSLPLPPQPSDLGKSSSSVSDISSVKPQTPPKTDFHPAPSDPLPAQQKIEEKPVANTKKTDSKKTEELPPILPPKAEVASKVDPFGIDAIRESWPNSPKPEQIPEEHHAFQKQPTVIEKSEVESPQADYTPKSESLPEAVPIAVPKTTASVPHRVVATVPQEPEEIQEEVLQSFRVSQMSPGVPRPGKLELSPTGTEREQKVEENGKPPEAQQQEDAVLPEDGVLREELLANVQGTPFSPSIPRPGKLELSTPREPVAAFDSPSSNSIATLAQPS